MYTQQCRSLSILYLVPDLIGQPGGIARYSQMICQALLNLGAQLKVVALIDSPQGQSHAKQFFPDMGYSACNGQRTLFVYEAYRIALHQRPDIIFVGHVNFAPLGWSLARISRAKMVTSIYGVDAWYSLPFARQRGLNQSDQIISISSFTAQTAREANHLNEKKIRILWNCLDPYFENEGKVEKDLKTLTLLTVARINEAEQYKGHDNVIRALPVLLQQFPHLVYNVVGDGNGRPILERLATQLGVAHAIHFQGVVTDEELRHHYAQASLFIMPSHREGFGFVFLEAMAHGLPVIGGNIDATPEVVIDGETGLLVNPTCVDEIVQAVSCLLSDYELRKRMGEAGILHVQQKFSFPQFQKTLCDHLLELEPDLK